MAKLQHATDVLRNVRAARLKLAALAPGSRDLAPDGGCTSFHTLDAFPLPAAHSMPHAFPLELSPVLPIHSTCQPHCSALPSPAQSSNGGPTPVSGPFWGTWPPLAGSNLPYECAVLSHPQHAPVAGSGPYPCVHLPCDTSRGPIMPASSPIQSGAHGQQQLLQRCPDMAISNVMGLPHSSAISIVHGEMPSSSQTVQLGPSSGTVHGYGIKDTDQTMHLPAQLPQVLDSVIWPAPVQHAFCKLCG